MCPADPSPCHRSRFPVHRSRFPLHQDQVQWLRRPFGAGIAGVSSSLRVKKIPDCSVCKLDAANGCQWQALLHTFHLVGGDQDPERFIQQIMCCANGSST